MKPENERIEVHEVRGFVASDLLGAFRESYAISRSTQCKQHLYSLSLSPPKDDVVSTVAFDQAIAEAEERLGLIGQPRAIVIHEKRGDDGQLRRHAHAVWCRIDTQRMKAVQLSFTHTKLQSLSRDLYLENGWQMPRGLLEKRFCNPRNFTLQEWQQAKRRKKEPRLLKAMFQDAWAMSDGRGAFTNALMERGYALARGNRRGFVAVDHAGEVYSLSRWVGVKAKELRSQLGHEELLTSTNQAQKDLIELGVTRLQVIQDEALAKKEAAKANLEIKVRSAKTAYSTKAASLKAGHKLTLESLAREQATHFRTGLLGLLDRLNGRRKRIAEENRIEREKVQRKHDRQKVELQAVLAQKMATAAEKARTDVRDDRTIRAIGEEINALRQRLPEAETPKRRQTRRARDGPSR